MQATFNTLVSAALKREIKFKTTEKSIMAADVTDAANKAVVAKKGNRRRSPLTVLWTYMQARCARTLYETTLPINLPYPSSYFSPPCQTFCNHFSSIARGLLVQLCLLQMRQNC